MRLNCQTFLCRTQMGLQEASSRIRRWLWEKLCFSIRKISLLPLRAKPTSISIHKLIGHRLQHPLWTTSRKSTMASEWRRQVLLSNILITSLQYLELLLSSSICDKLTIMLNFWQSDRRLALPAARLPSLYVLLHKSSFQQPHAP